NKWWIPTNFSAIDLNTFVAATGSIPDLPGFIYFGGDDTFTPYRLKDGNTAEMILPYARDLVEPQISEVNGKKVLNMMSYTFIDAQDVTGLGKDETISIARANENQVRKLDADGIFKVTIPEGGRVIIFAPDFTLSHDSLYATAESVPVTAGSYVIFIGNEGDSFPYEYTF
ncbi:MAG: hypothetical protein CVV01_05500, partial [Firmicutes bacterium HGW-Firmicutes-6]